MPQDASFTPNILEVLDGVTFPATVMDLVAFAEDQGASEDVLDEIQALPDLIYHGMADINNHLGQIEPLPGPIENQWSTADSEDIPNEEDRAVAASGLGDWIGGS